MWRFLCRVLHSSAERRWSGPGVAGAGRVRSSSWCLADDTGSGGRKSSLLREEGRQGSGQRSSADGGERRACAPAGDSWSRGSRRTSSPADRVDWAFCFRGSACARGGEAPHEEEEEEDQQAVYLRWRSEQKDSSNLSLRLEDEEVQVYLKIKATHLQTLFPIAAENTLFLFVFLYYKFKICKNRWKVV